MSKYKGRSFCKRGRIARALRLKYGRSPSRGIRRRTSRWRRRRR